MTRDEARLIEAQLTERDGDGWLDKEGADPGGTWRTPRVIVYTPQFSLMHDGHPAHAVNLRHELAAQLRRVAAYLEL